MIVVLYIDKYLYMSIYIITFVCVFKWFNYGTERTKTAEIGSTG